MMEEHKESKSKLNVGKLFSAKIWQIATVALIVILAVSVVTQGFSFTGFSSGSAQISAQQAANKAINYVNDLMQGQATATFINVTEFNGLYRMAMTVGGQPYDSYVTKDGSLLFPLGYAMPASVPTTPQNTTPVTPAPTAAPKTDKPVAELYIFSYCPAGTAALNAFAQAAKTLSSVADVSVKFFSNMHGEYEKQQNMIQECVQTIAKDKYWDYATGFVSDIYPVCGSSRSVECDRNASIELMDSLGINSSAVMACVSENGAQFYENDQNDAAFLQLQYSPSVVINGVYLSSASRTPDGLKTLICNAFTAAPPVCGQVLNSTATAATGSCGA